MTHVPYRGSAPLTNDLLANTVNSAFVDLTTASTQIKAGKLRALAVGGEKRRNALPDVPTMGELGYPGFEIEGWLGVFVPAATPKEIVTKLSDGTRPHHRLARGRCRNRVAQPRAGGWIGGNVRESPAPRLREDGPMS